jgi:hypothetical protein
MLETNRYGQNSTWGFVNQHYDFTGRPPQAFSNWMEEGDIQANGYDLSPWDPKYFNAGAAGGRVGFYLNFSTRDQNPWSASTAVLPFDTSAGGLRGASVIKVTASDNNAYTWYCTTGGTTGSVQPTWPTPVRFAGTITGNQLTVTSVTTGTLVAGAYLSGNGFIVPLKITGQTSGTTGGAGVYTLDVSIPGGGATTGAFFAAPQVADGTAVWSFGTTYQLGVSQALYLTGSADVATVIGGNTQISNAVLDTSGFKLDAGAAAIRLAPGQSIDLTSQASQASNPSASSINQHTLQYSTQAGWGALRYQVGGASVLTVDDAGNLIASSLTLPANAPINFTKGQTHTLQYSPLVGSGALAYIAGTAVPFTLDDAGNQTLTGSLTAASLQLGTNTPINFTKGQTHTLQYSPFVGSGALAYIAGTAVPFTLDDAGNASFTGHITTPLATPASSSAPCKAGQQQADGKYSYVCVATNNWKRAALSSF